VSFEVRPAKEAPSDGFSGMMEEASKKIFYVSREVLLSNTDVASARATNDQWGGRVEITCTDKGAERLARALGTHMSQRLAMVIDGKLFAAPIVSQVVTTGRLSISVPSAEAAESYARRIVPE
jgi:preprotein translocase subunit SecD